MKSTFRIGASGRSHAAAVGRTDARLHGGKPNVSEEIWSGSVMYIMTRGKWIQSPIDVAAMRKDRKARQEVDSKATCTHVRDECSNVHAPAGVK